MLSTSGQVLAPSPARFARACGSTKISTPTRRASSSSSWLRQASQLRALVSPLELGFWRKSLISSLAPPHLRGNISYAKCKRVSSRSSGKTHPAKSISVRLAPSLLRLANSEPFSSFPKRVWPSHLLIFGTARFRNEASLTALWVPVQSLWRTLGFTSLERRLRLGLVRIFPRT